jgi:hypothetical protein
MQVNSSKISFLSIIWNNYNNNIHNRIKMEVISCFVYTRLKRN